MKEIIRRQIEETTEEAVDKLWKLFEKGGIKSVVSVVVYVTLAGEEAEREAERVASLLGYTRAGSGGRGVGRRLSRGSLPLVGEID